MDDSKVGAGTSCVRKYGLALKKEKAKANLSVHKWKGINWVEKKAFT